MSETTGGTTTYPRDVTLHADNENPGGIWSNGTTLWVVDTTDDKVYAYTLATGSRDTGSEFSLHSENDELGRIWSHSTTMWVPDRVGQKIYTYNAPDLPTLTALSVSYGSPAVTPTLAPVFDSGRLAYAADVPYNITQVTVAATAAAGVTATFVQEDGTTAQSDDDSVTSGHQVGLAVGDNVIRVRAVKGGYSRIYTVTVKRAKPAVIVSADAAKAGEGLALSFTVSRSPSAPDSLTVKLEISETGGLVPPGSEGMKTVLIPANMPSAKYTVTTDAGDEAWDAHSTVTVALAVDTDSPYTLGALNSAQTRVLDDDFPAATAALTVNPATASEGGTVTVTVTVTTGSDQMPHEEGGTITLSTAAVSAQTDDYGTLSETTFTLAQADFSAVTVGGNSRYQATYTATVGIVDDPDEEGAETFTVSMARGSDLDAQVTLGTPASRTITIPANDAAGQRRADVPRHRDRRTERGGEHGLRPERGQPGGGDGHRHRGHPDLQPGGYGRRVLHHRRRQRPDPDQRGAQPRGQEQLLGDRESQRRHGERHQGGDHQRHRRGGAAGPAGCAGGGGAAGRRRQPERELERAGQHRGARPSTTTTCGTGWGPPGRSPATASAGRAGPPPSGDSPPTPNTRCRCRPTTLRATAPGRPPGPAAPTPPRPWPPMTPRCRR